MKCSVICCVSDPKVYQQCLLDSVNRTRGDHKVEIIPILNLKNQYSASNALNVGIDVARTDILVFAHQDVCLLDEWFDHLETTINSLGNDWGVIGAAGIALEYGIKDIGCWGGALKKDTVAIGAVWGSDKNLDELPYWSGERRTTKVHCVDECLLVLNRPLGLRFDPVFTGFHFYGVDVCLQARAAAYPVYGAYLPIIHYGRYSASFIGDRKYWIYLRLLHHRWHMRFPELYGTHMHWCTRDKLPIPKEEITSYISINLDANDGCPIQLKAMGINKVKIANDRIESC